MSEKSELIAIHRVHYGRDAVANPGETFSVDSDTAGKLVASKAARRAPEAAVLTSPKAGPKTKRTTTLAKPKAPEAALAEAEETLD